jgi:hypothetical protein
MKIIFDKLVYIESEMCYSKYNYVDICSIALKSVFFFLSIASTHRADAINEFMNYGLISYWILFVFLQRNVVSKFNIQFVNGVPREILPFRHSFRPRPCF